MKPNCTDRATLVAEQVPTGPREECQKMMRIFSNPFFDGLPLNASKDDEKKLIGPRMVRRLGGVPCALAGRELHMPDLAKPEGFKLITVFLEKKGYKKDALDKRLFASRRYETISRLGQTFVIFLCDREHWHTEMLQRLAWESILTGVPTTCLFGVASQMTRSITFTVSCTIPAAATLDPRE